MCMPSIQNYILGLLQTVILAKRKRKEKIITTGGDRPDGDPDLDLNLGERKRRGSDPDPDLDPELDLEQDPDLMIKGGYQMIEIELTL